MESHDDAPDDLRERLEFLRRLGFDTLQHDSHVPFMAHLAGTRRVLREWGCRDALADAGLFHSVYGTEYFEPDTTASRDDVRALIGDEAEEIAWLWCVIERDGLDPDALTAPHRVDGTVLELRRDRFADVVTLWCADTYEQLDRMEDDERAFATGLQRVIDHADPMARRATAPLVAELAPTE